MDIIDNLPENIKNAYKVEMYKLCIHRCEQVLKQQPDNKILKDCIKICQKKYEQQKKENELGIRMFLYLFLAGMICIIIGSIIIIYKLIH